MSPEAPLSGEDALSCVVGAAEDPDGDPLGYTVSWTVDGVAWGSGVSADDSPPTPETVSGSETSGGQEWICTAVVDDGEDDSEPGQANVLIHASYLCLNRLNRP